MSLLGPLGVTAGGAGAGALVLLQHTTLSVNIGPNITPFTSIPGGYYALVAEVFGKVTDAVFSAGIGVQFNGDTSSHYVQGQFLQAIQTQIQAGSTSGVSTTNIEMGALSGSSAFPPGLNRIFIPGYTSTTWAKVMFGQNASAASLGGNATTQLTLFGGVWNPGSPFPAITSMTFTDLSGGNFVASTTFNLYGQK